MRLLEDVRRIFGRRVSDRITTANLLADLVSDEESPWVELHKGKPISAAGLARLLKPFGISSRTIWLSDDSECEPDGSRTKERTKKGYHRERFEDAWARYLGSESSGPSAGNGYALSSDTPEPSGDDSLTGAQAPEKADKHGRLTALTAESPDNGHVRVSDADDPMLRAALDTFFITEATYRAETDWRPCRVCSGVESWTRQDGTLICATCHPSPFAATGGAA